MHVEGEKPCLMQSPMAARVPRMSRSRQDDHSGTCKNVIGARCTGGNGKAAVFVVWDGGDCRSKTRDDD